MKKRIVRDNQKGYSLVEVLVAVTILGIVVLSLLRMFVISANTNSNSRKLLAATTVAENLMEEMKAEGIASVLERERENVVLDKATGTYILTQKDILLDGKTHYAKVTLDPNTYAGVGENKYNDTALADVFYMDSRQDATYVESADAREEVLKHYEKQGHPEFEQTLSRTITIKVEAVGDLNGDYNTKVKITSKYTTTSSDIETSRKEYEEFKDYSIYDSSQVDGKLRGIYLCYTPLYRTGSPADTIVIENEKEVPINVYLIRQKTGDYNAEKDAKYRVTVGVKEKSRILDTDRKIEGDPASGWKTAPSYVASTKICTNIDWNLDDVSQKLSNRQGTFNYTRLGLAADSNKVGSILQLGGIIPTSKKERLYEVKVAIYADQEEETEIFKDKNQIVQIDSTITK